MENTNIDALRKEIEKHRAKITEINESKTPAEEEMEAAYNALEEYELQQELALVQLELHEAEIEYGLRCLNEQKNPNI
jgi:uncharacterized protein (DUF3084 family)